MGDLNIKPNTQGKIAQTDYDFWLTQSDDTCLYCLSKRQIAILLTALPMSEWRTRWFSLIGTEPNMDLIQAEIAKIETELMTNHCDLQTALTNIENSITTINNNVLTINTDITTINNTLTVVENNILTINNNVLNVSVQNNILNVNITNNLTYTTNSADKLQANQFARYNGFCLAMMAWIYSAALSYGAAVGYTAAFVSVMEALSGASGVDPIFGFPIITAPVTPFTQAEVTAAFSDSAAVSDVACAMITYLQNLLPSQLTFQAALNGYTPPVYPDNRAIVATVLSISLNAVGTFQAWAAIDEYYFEVALAQNPTDYVCAPCGVPNLACGFNIWDFTQLQLLPWTITRGVLTQGKGIVGVPVPGDAGYAFEANLYFPTGCQPLAGSNTYVHFTLLGLPQNANFSFYTEMYHMVAGVETLKEYYFSISEATYPTPIVTSRQWPFDSPGVFTTISRIRIVSNTYFNTPSGGNWITPTYSALLKAEFNGTA